MDLVIHLDGGGARLNGARHLHDENLLLGTITQHYVADDDAIRNTPGAHVKLQKIFSEWTWMGLAERRPAVGVRRETVGCKNNRCRLKIVFDNHRLEMAVTIAG